MAAAKKTKDATGDPEICLECFPDGWDGLPEGAYAPGCQHGAYLHPGRIPQETAPEAGVVEASAAEGGMDLGEDVRF